MLRTRSTRIVLVVCLLFIASTVTVYLVQTLARIPFHASHLIEAGDAFPEADTFFPDAVEDAVYLSAVSAIDTRQAGTHDLQIRCQKRTYKVQLIIRDTRPPVLELQALDLMPGEQPAADAFVALVEDVSPVTVSFLQAPDFRQRETQRVNILAVDAAGNRTVVTSSLRLSPLLEEQIVEASAINRMPDPRLFLKDRSQEQQLRWISGPPRLNLLGVHPVTLLVGDTLYRSSMRIEDTVPPYGRTRDLEAWVGDDLEARAFLTDLQDATQVTVNYTQAPDFTRPGPQTVHLELVDEAGLSSQLTAQLSLEEDTEPPIIYGAQKVTLYLGQTATYKKGVYAVDNRDGDVDIHVDTSTVNPRETGTYDAIYTATDRAGNSTSVTVTVSVIPQAVTLDELHAYADAVLAQITTPAMSRYEKAWQVYLYVNKQVTYTGYSDKTDWMAEAKRGFTIGVGDCFTYYALSEVLLNRIGLQTMGIERLRNPGDTQHFWHLVKIGEDWYHFDAGIHGIPYESFMVTTKQIEAYSARMGRNGYFYRFDQSLYPQTPEEPINDPNVEGMY